MTGHLVLWDVEIKDEPHRVYCIGCAWGCTGYNTEAVRAEASKHVALNETDLRAQD